MNSFKKIVNYHIIAIAISTCPTVAQIATFDWQVSIDGGTTWRTGFVEAPESQQSVLIRGHIQWTPMQNVVFASVNFDATVRTRGRVAADITDQYASEEFNWMYGVRAFSATRFDDVLKVDRFDDLEPPGVGRGGIMPGQLAPNMGSPIGSNPISVFQYRLTLDGVAGEREIGGLFRTAETGSVVSLWGLWGGTNYTSRRLPTTVTEVTLRVVPAPGAAAILCLCGGWFAQRRRRG
jgi:hypothetical protein